jgi:hypothetical protein
MAGFRRRFGRWASVGFDPPLGLARRQIPIPGEDYDIVVFIQNDGMIREKQAKAAVFIEGERAVLFGKITKTQHPSHLLPFTISRRIFPAWRDSPGTDYQRVN